MSHFHNSREAEQLALGFHMLGVLVGLFGAGFALAAVYAFDSVITIAAALGLHTLSEFFFANWLFAILWVFYNLMQVIWHVKASREHLAHLKTLNS